MKKVLFLIFLFLLFSSSISFAQKHSLSKKTDKVFHQTKFNINNISTFIRNDGDCDLSPSNDSGFEYPKGSGKTVIFESGLVWGGKIDGKIYVGGNSYNQGIVGGRILENGTPQDPAEESARVFRVRSVRSPQDLTSELEDEELSAEEIRLQYEKDWDEWPAEHGAPYYDVDNNGIYNPSIDIPGVPNSDQTLWFVANDFDTTICRSVYGSDPMKLEIQVTIWGFKNRVQPYDNVMFKKYKLINKNDKNIDSMYVSKWSDSDLGGAGDDYVGCDTLLNLSYSYNGDDDDSQYGQVIPAVGYSYLGQRLLTSHITIQKSGEHYDDPNLGDYSSGSLRFYKYMQGLNLSGNNIKFPESLGSANTNYMHSGDPTTKTGWIDGTERGPGDRRFISTSGPFTLAAGDTQEVIMAEIAAIGVDRLNSVKLLKYYAKLLKIQNGESPAKLPTLIPPIVNYNDSKEGILLSWDDERQTNLIENFDSNGYSFQGYNVYQLDSNFSLRDEVTKIATFDIVDGITNITGTVMDETGKPTEGIQQFGTDSGIQREFLITKDFINNDELIKGKNYLFAVTAYSHNKDSVRNNNSESTLSIIEIDFIRNLEGANFGDTIKVTQTNGIGGKVLPIIVRPSALTGLDYTVSFEEIKQDSIIWHLDRSDSTRILENQEFTWDSYYDPSPIIDGFKITVIDLEGGFQKFSVVANSNGLLDTIEAAAPEWQGFPVPTDSNGIPRRPTENQQVGSGKWMFGTGDPRANRGSYESFLSRSSRNDDFYRLIPFDWEMRFTTSGSYAVKAFTTGEIVRVPFELWNTGIATPTDPRDDYRLIPWFLETTGGGGAAATDPLENTYQLDPVDHGASGGSDDPQTPWIYWRIPSDNSFGTAGYDAFVASLDLVNMTEGNYDYASPEALARTVLFNWNADNVSDGEVASGTQMVPENGTIFRIETNKMVEPGVDKFTFTSPTNPLLEPPVRPTFNLSQNYPNPFNNSTIINFSIERGGRTKVVVYNILGQKVATLVNKNLLPGNYETQFSATNLASGVYIYRIETFENYKSKKMLLLK